MPIISADHATRIAEKLLQGAGAPENESKIVARHVISANLAGHDSHGIIQIPTYIERVLNGDIVPGAKWEIIQESPTTTVVDGHWGFGYVANERAMQLTIEKAQQQNVAATTVFRQGHIGRLATYPLMAAKEGMIARYKMIGQIILGVIISYVIIISQRMQKSICNSIVCVIIYVS